MNFDELLRMVTEQETLVKALDKSDEDEDDDKKIAAAAKDGKKEGGVKGTTDSDPDADDEDGEDDDEPMVKSFKLVLEDGTEMEAQDATVFLKTLTTTLAEEKTSREAESAQFLKAFGSTLGLINSLTTSLQSTRDELASAQEQIASLSKQGETMTKSLAALGNEGRGRRSTVTVIDKPSPVAAAPAAPRPAEIMAKAMSAFGSGAITAIDATRVEAAINSGVMPDKEILDRIFAK